MAASYGWGRGWTLGRHRGNAPELERAAAAVGSAAAALVGRGYLATGLVLLTVLGLTFTKAAAVLGDSYVVGWIANGVLVGGLGSALAGWVGLRIALGAGRHAAGTAGLGRAQALAPVAIGGAAVGAWVAGLALAGVAGYYWVAQAALPVDIALRGLLGGSLGGSLSSLAARVGMGTGAAGAGLADQGGDPPRDGALLPVWPGIASGWRAWPPICTKA